jgi:crotonobetainyl-CoA:carnitine CoA-transferase CaiB-like acyl-CoA transferase
MFLDPYRVLDLADHRGQFCGKILADLGADVIKIEPPGGDPSRMTGPFLDDDQDLEKSVSWFANNTSKKSVVLDIEQEDGRSEFLELVKNAKFIIESFHPGHMEKLGLAFKKLSQINRGLIMVSITPFGRTGPYADFKDSDLINMGMGGQMTICGDRDRAPLRFTAEQSYPLVGMYAAFAALAAHLEREKTGLGQHIDVSIQESVLQTARGIRIYWEIQNYLEQREGSRMARGVLSFRNIWRCKEGMISWRLFTANLGKWTQALVEWMEEESGAEYLPGVAWEEIDMAGLSQQEINRYEAPFEKFFLEHTKEELFEESLKRRFVLFPLSTTKDLVENEQLNSRDFWEEVSYPELGRTIKHPGIPFRSPGLCSAIRRPPRVGEHSREILGRKDGGRLEVEQPSGRPRVPENSGPPLEGVKILDFSWIIAGPKATKFLANLGATVVRVESEQRLDFLRAYPPFPDGIPGVDRSGTFAHLNDGKYGFTLNLKHPEAGTVLRRLVKWADVVLENFTPGTMERFGLSYDDLKRINPEIIMFRASLMGQTGPYAGQTGLGTMLQAYAGFSHLIGWPDRAPVGTAAAYTDYPAAGFIDIGILAAIDYKRRTGRGLVVDMSQLEAAQQLLIPALLDYTANGRVLEADGNRHPDACPHGAYPCLGDDRWGLMAVFDDQEWEGIKAAMGNPDWAESGKFSTLKSRKANEDELDRQISAWTIKHSPEEIMALLQKAGVPAGMVKNGRDIHEDIQLKHRDYLVQLTHQEMGKMFYDKPPFRFSRTPFEMKLPSPCLGEHTELVCREFLGMNDEEFIGLLSDGVFE